MRFLRGFNRYKLKLVMLRGILLMEQAIQELLMVMGKQHRVILVQQVIIYKQLRVMLHLLRHMLMKYNLKLE